MKYYLSHALLGLLYLFFSAITAFAILMIEGLIWLKVILLVLNLGLYIFIVATVAKKDGEDALKVRIANDLERCVIIQTGEDIPLKKGEFKWWKGFVIGGVVCAPLVILLLIHTVLIIVNPTMTGAGAIAGFLYMMIFAFFRMDVVVAENVNATVGGAVQTNMPLSAGFFYWSLIAIPVIVLTIGIAYYLGGKKIELQQQKIKEKQRLLSGE